MNTPTRADVLDAAIAECQTSCYQVQYSGDPIMTIDGAFAKLRRTLASEASIIADAARYRWLRDLRCCTFTLSRDDGHAFNYTTLTKWIEEYSTQDVYADVPADELQRMKDTNTDWCLHVYPDTPIGFWEIHGATLDAAIDAAIRKLVGGKT